MEEILKENPKSSAETDIEAKPLAAETRKQTWRQWLESDAAVRTVYLIFGFIVIFLLKTHHCRQFEYLSIDNKSIFGTI